MTHMYISARTHGIRTFRHALRAAYRTAISAAQILVYFNFVWCFCNTDAVLRQLVHANVLLSDAFTPVAYLWMGGMVVPPSSLVTKPHKKPPKCARMHQSNIITKLERIRIKIPKSIRTPCLKKNCANLCTSELRQISTNFDNSRQKHDKDSLSPFCQKLSKLVEI